MEIGERARMLARSLQGRESQVSSIEDLIGLVDSEPPKEPRLAGIVYVRNAGSEVVLKHGHITGPRDHNAGDEEFANKHIALFARRYDFDLLVPPGSFYRWTSDQDEALRGAAGELPPSRNYRTNLLESGLSVAEGPWVYCRERRFCWFVKGRQIAQRGSDGEPLLDVRTLEIVADMMGRRQVLVDLYQRNRQRLADVSRESGVPEVELFALLVGLH